jgi:hypothetical protein
VTGWGSDSRHTNTGHAHGVAPSTGSELAQMERLERLTHARDLLSDALSECGSSRDLPALSREYRAVLSEIDSLSGGEVKDVVDQLAERREAKTA